jgi:hypothetical protein
MGRVKSAIYARMEEMSFRSGAGLAAGVLAAAVTAIVLAVTLSGHGTAGTGAGMVAAQGPGTARPAPSPTRSPAASSSRPRPATDPASSPATPAASLAPVAAYLPPAPTAAAAPAYPAPWPAFEPDGARWHHRVWRGHRHQSRPGWG